MGNSQSTKGRRRYSQESPYPKQSAAYPTQQMATAPPLPMVAGPPPSYAEAIAPVHHVQQHAPYTDSKVHPQRPDHHLYQQAHEAPIAAAVHHPYQSMPMGHPVATNYPVAPLPVGPNPNAPTTYVIPGAFDAGARFDGRNPPRIPPPPPGVAPNAAQMAYAQGHQVVATKKQDNFLTGGRGAGHTFW